MDAPADQSQASAQRKSTDCSNADHQCTARLSYSRSSRDEGLQRRLVTHAPHSRLQPLPFETHQNPGRKQQRPEGCAIGIGAKNGAQETNPLTDLQVGRQQHAPWQSVRQPPPMTAHPSVTMPIIIRAAEQSQSMRQLESRRGRRKRLGGHWRAPNGINAGRLRKDAMMTGRFIGGAAILRKATGVLQASTAGSLLSRPSAVGDYGRLLLVWSAQSRHREAGGLTANVLLQIRRQFVFEPHLPNAVAHFPGRCCSAWTIQAARLPQSAVRCMVTWLCRPSRDVITNN